MPNAVGIVGGAPVRLAAVVQCGGLLLLLALLAPLPLLLWGRLVGDTFGLVGALLMGILLSMPK